MLFRSRRLYESAAAEFEQRGVKHSDACINAFIKDEKMNMTKKDDPCPRIIQPRRPVFNVAIGRYLKPMEKEIFRGIAEVFRGVTVMKGYNADDRGRFISGMWKQFRNPVGVLLDAKRFDQHVSKDLLRWESGIFQSLTQDPRGFSRINRLRSVNRCWARSDGGYVKYSVDGCRMSGDMDTALGNCLSMCAMTWSYMRNLGVRKYRYANDGDDGVLIIEREHLETVLSTFNDYFVKLGFTMKLEGLAYELEEVEFCQARPIYDGDHWRMVRDPRVCVDKDTLSLKRVRDLDEFIYLRNAVGWCGAALAGDMPIFCALYSKMVTGEAPSYVEKTTGMHFLAHGMEAKFSEPTDDARSSFFFAYGIPPHEQVELERTIRDLTWEDHAPIPGDVSRTIQLIY